MNDRSGDTKSMALFCDFENVALGVREARYHQFDINKVLERLLLKGSIVVKKAYCDWERYREFKASMHQASFELIEIPHLRMSGKNSADIRMVVDALDLCYTKSHVDTFVIISGDSDFSPLVSKLRENAKTVIGVGVKNSTSELLINNCDEFIYYDDLVRNARAPRRRSGSGQGAGQGSGQGSGQGAGHASGRSPGPRETPLPSAPHSPRALPSAPLVAAPSLAADAQAVVDSMALAAAGGAVAGEEVPALAVSADKAAGEGLEKKPAPRARSRRGSSKAAAAAALAEVSSQGVSPETSAASGAEATGTLDSSSVATNAPSVAPNASVVAPEVSSVTTEATSASMPEAPAAKASSRRRRGTPKKAAADAQDAATDAASESASATTPAEIDAGASHPATASLASAVPSGTLAVPAAIASPRAELSVGASDLSGQDQDDFPDRDQRQDDRMQQALDLVVSTIEALATERGGGEKIWGSMVKQTLKRRRPGFNEAYFGFRSFNRLLEEARDRGLVELELDDKSGGYTVRSLG